MSSAAPERTPAHFRAGSGSTLVLLHGMSMSWRIWEPALPLLVSGHHVFAPTLAGHRGGPDLLGASPLGVTAVVDTLCDQLDRAGIGTAHMVGNSLGGWVALEMARRGRARSVTAISPAGSWKANRYLLALLWTFKLAHLAISTPMLAKLAHTRLVRRGSLRRLMARPRHIPDDELVELIAEALQFCLGGAERLSGRVSA